MNSDNEAWFGQAFEGPCEPVEINGKFFCPYVSELEVKLKETKSRSEQEIKS